MATRKTADEKMTKSVKTKKVTTKSTSNKVDVKSKKVSEKVSNKKKVTDKCDSGTNKSISETITSTESMVKVLKSYRKRVRLSTMDEAIYYFMNLNIKGWKATNKDFVVTFSKPKVGKVKVELTPKGDSIYTKYTEV